MIYGWTRSKIFFTLIHLDVLAEILIIIESLNNFGSSAQSCEMLEYFWMLENLQSTQ